MNEEQLNRQKFIDYIEGHLNLEEKTKIDTYLDENPLERLALEASIEYNDKEPIATVLDRLDETIDTRIRQQEPSPPIHQDTRIVPLKKWLGIAASIILLCVAGYLGWSHAPFPNEDVFATHFDLYPDNITSEVRGVSIENENLLVAMQYYENAQFSHAIEIFYTLDTIKEVPFFIAICELGRGNAVESLMMLNKLHKNNELSNMQDGIEWYRALALFKMEKYEEAKVIFERIASSNHYKAEQAKKILNKCY